LGWFQRGEFWRRRREKDEIKSWSFEERVRRARVTCNRKPQILF
jgi:hypothetical protein